LRFFIVKYPYHSFINYNTTLFCFATNGKEKPLVFTKYPGFFFAFPLEFVFIFESSFQNLLFAKNSCYHGIAYDIVK
ncbi:MAG: hypothetical protein J6A68_02620, partial [Oscillospiraceae bacterium]|nr:hypothetical protein [Oscillospiraceae bacterium]